MRTHDAGERTLLGSGTFSQHKKVEIQNEDGTWIDVTAFLESYSIRESVDTNTASAQVTFLADHGALSLHPLRTDSTMNRRDDGVTYSPILFGGRGFRISVGTGTPHAAAPSYPWHKAFEGTTDTPKATDDGAKIGINARDGAALLLDTIIEKDRSYGSETGVALEVVLHQIIQDNTMGALALTQIEVPTSPDWQLRERPLGRGSLWDIMRGLVQQIAWDIRFFFDDSDVSRPYLYDPDRTRPLLGDPGYAPDFTLPPDEYLKVDELSFGDLNVRNRIKVGFKNRLKGNALDSVTVQDDSSIAVYKVVKYMEVSEESSSNIDTPAEALKMAMGMLTDLSTPFVDHVITTFDLWFAELGDLIEFPENSVHYDEDQAFAIVEIIRTWQDGHGLVTFRTRGKPAGAYNDWIRKAGRAPDGSVLPAPGFGALHGEESVWGGVSGDGMLWLPTGFEPNTQFVDYYVEELEFTPVGVPEVSVVTHAWRLYRPPGRLQEIARNPSTLAGLVRSTGGNLNSIVVSKSKPSPSLQDWYTFVGFATRPLWWKRIRAIGYNWAGAAGPEFISAAVQAKDIAPIVDGVVTGLSVTATPTATSFGQNTIVVDVGTLDPNHPSYLCIMRNGMVLVPIYIGYQSTSQWTFLDKDLDLSLTHTYDAFIWTRGVTGARFSTSTPTPPVPPGTPAADTVVWIDPTPDAVRVGGTFNNVHVRAQYIHNCAWATKVALQVSPDGANPWVDIVGPLNTTAVSGEMVHASGHPNWYRWRVANADDSIQAFSVERFFTQVKVKPPPPAAALRFVNGSPYLNAAGDKVRLEYQCTVALAHHVVLMRSPDGITYTDVDSSTTLIGEFEYANLADAHYQLRAEDVVNGDLAWSAPVAWRNLPGPVPNAPPIILPGSPTVQLLLGVPHMRIDYDSNISWFSAMRLQASADGVSAWVTIPSFSNPSPSDFFLYNSAVPAWFRLEAVNANDTLRLHSVPVFFAGIGPPGGPDTTPPVLTISVQNDASGLPQLVIAWDCDNAQAIEVTIEKSADGVSGWAEVNSSGAVLNGRWTGGDPDEDAYYRAHARNSFDQIIATSAVEYWAGGVYVA